MTVDAQSNEQTVSEIPTEAELIDAAAEAVVLDDTPEGEQTEPATKEETSAPEEQKTETKEETKTEEPEGEKKAEAEKEADKEPEKKDDPKDSPKDKSWEALKLAERRFRSETEAFKRDKDALAAQQTDIDALKKSIASMREEGGKDPLAFMQKHFGLTFNDLAERAVQSGPGSAETVRKTSEKYHGELEKLTKAVQDLKDQTKKQEEQTLIDDYKKTIDKTLDNEQFSLLSTYPGGATNELLKRASVAASNGEYLTLTEAAARLQEEYKEYLTTLVSHKVVSETLGLQAPQQSQPDSGQSHQAPQQDSGQKPKTLTNGLAAPPPRRTVKELASMTEEELIAEAAKLVPDA